MKEGDIVIASIKQADGIVKKRPVLILKTMPFYHDFLVCGISSQLYHFVDDFDELLVPNDVNGLKKTSIIRLGFLGIEPQENIQGKIGSIDSTLHHTILERLAKYLVS